jgi:peptide-methionine (S)-S-oxide reductase
MSHTIQKVAFGGGCFWCTEAVFLMIEGVEKVYPAYTGGTIPHPTYEQVCTGDTGHVEVAVVEYDSTKVSFDDLLTVFFASHDPTTKNRQGNDVGTQYRSVIFYETEEQKTASEEYIKHANESSQFGDPVVTTVEPLGEVYEAEEYHKNYYNNHTSAPYCALIINPKLEKVKEKFAYLLKRNS